MPMLYAHVAAKHSLLKTMATRTSSSGYRRSDAAHGGSLATWRSTTTASRILPLWSSTNPYVDGPGCTSGGQGRSSSGDLGASHDRWARVPPSDEGRRESNARRRRGGHWRPCLLGDR